MSDRGFDPHIGPAPTLRPSWWLRAQGVAMILVLAAGFGAGLAALVSLRGQEALRARGSAADLLGGSMAGAVNAVMAHDLPGDAAWRAAGGILRWSLFRSGGPQVSPGCANWLFLPEELRPWPDAQRSMAARADAVRRVAQRAQARGVRLLVALVPDKARIEHGALCGVRYPAQSQARYRAFLALVQARGVPTADLLTAFATAPDPAALYYRTDSHWSQAGAALAAQTAAAMAPAGLIARDQAFSTSFALESARPGDLLRLMSLEHVPDGWGLRPRPDRERAQTMVPLGAAAAGGLLDTPPPPQVALIGSSFSLNSNFHGALQQALGTQVAQFATAGGGFWGAAAQYFASAAWRDTPPKLIVWEIPERVVDQPLATAEGQLAP
jgi:alginate O-acetyltransferase complex protein AlgJ